MKIKSYRAPSLREALMQIKEELGEDALVLETKQVKAGGLFGVGARNLIEVRVAPNDTGKPAPNAAAERARVPPPPMPPPLHRPKLNLTDDSAATPAPRRAPSFEVNEEQGLKAFAALAARAYAGNSGPRATEATPNRAPHRAPEPNREGVELADFAPRIVHRRPPSSAADQHPEPLFNQPGAVRPSTTISTGTTTATATGVATKSKPALATERDPELARLWAELREMKFTLGAVAARPAARPAVVEDDPALYDAPTYETYQELRNAGLAAGLARQAVKNAVVSSNAYMAHDRAHLALSSALPNWVQFADAVLSGNGAAAFIGSTGVGKTTTIAKLAAHIALRARRRVELITLDTYRIAAVQQLKTYAEIISAGCHVARSVAELDALLRRFAKQATVLIDTTGRSPHDLADQLEFADYLRAQRSVLKCLVLPATNHPDEAQLALNKFALYGVNRLVLTKLDETVQPGAAVNVAVTAALPLLYLCAGQRVPEDLERATPAAFAQRVMRSQRLAQAA
ncbi:MAG: flagellar biosynthesis protein FlhF [Acidobacteria bacterium]|nr:flagellar biosynthesis protein FlhF [Acidobacteriota bacterium]